MNPWRTGAGQGNSTNGASTGGWGRPCDHAHAPRLRAPLLDPRPGGAVVPLPAGVAVTSDPAIDPGAARPARLQFGGARPGAFGITANDVLVRAQRTGGLPDAVVIETGRVVRHGGRRRGLRHSAVAGRFAMRTTQAGSPDRLQPPDMPTLASCPRTGSNHPQCPCGVRSACRSHYWQTVPFQSQKQTRGPVCGSLLRGSRSPEDLTAR